MDVQFIVKSEVKTLLSTEHLSLGISQQMKMAETFHKRGKLW